MTGLVKAKKYDFKDSNVALFGSDTDRKVKKESAETEPAWKGSGQNLGLQIWRVEKFKIVHWPRDDYGKFFEGDSYIILNTYKLEGEDQLLYDVHFWIGKYSTQDEYGTAAYKTVELDTLLDDKPVQHREVMNHESQLFKNYFPSLTYMKGGADSGFRHVKPEEYKPRLMQFEGKRKNVVVREVSLAKSSLNSDSVMLLDLGLQIYQWNGKTCNKDEKYKAVQFLQKLKSERGGKPKVETLDEIDGNDPDFYDCLPDVPDDDDVDDDDDEVIEDKKLVRLSDESGSLQFTTVKEGDGISKSDFKSQDVFILDTGKGVFVWVGRRTSESEKKNSLTYAHMYLQKSNNPLQPVTALKEGQKSREFEIAITA
ncbi:gelsolin-like protein 2 [Gigantopelta aegis]|uniref:gelsolin-like protein 2 n=1 Tax=Gigantopelta aegis TaxID=1735272 RepID=UPI001B88D811|nr:gelsolin-like protein 2 [Gigantopelta aegis]